MALFDNGEPEELLLFIWKYQITLEASGMIAADTNIWYICRVVRGEALHQLDILSVEVLGTTS